jgi:hypothetical protein
METNNLKPIIEYAGIEFHDVQCEPPIKLFDDPELYFGIYKLNIRNEIPITQKHIHILFTIDCSGSMQDMCGDGRTKMAHILHTLENMLRLFHNNPDINVSIHINAFDSKIYEITSNISDIKSADIETIITQIKGIYPRGSTNIELALQSASEHMSQFTIADCQKVHLFLTDGEVTKGSHDHNILSALVPPDTTNIFIGYGKDHDSQLLSCLSKNTTPTNTNEYRFIDALEKAALVYGEIIHGLLYKAIECVTIKVEHGEIYDYSENQWSSELYIGNLLSDQKKIYHIRTHQPRQIIVRVTNNKIHNETRIGMDSYDDLSVYIFRQRTQELLYEARRLAEKYKHNHIFKYLHFNDQNNPIEERKYKKAQLKDFFTLMMTYAEAYNMTNDPLLKMLCDDIYIVYKTFDTHWSHMFTCSRQTTQGRQQTYTCSDIDQPPMDGYTLSQNVLSPFSTCEVVELMRAVSDEPNVDFELLTTRTQH